MPARPRRRAVGPPGARRVAEHVRLPGDGDGDVQADVDAERARPDEDRDDERLRADRPPHHDRGV